MESAGDDDREDLVDLIEGLTDAMNADNSQAIQQAAEQLTDLIFFLES
jgi:hypothetical protein